MIFYSVHIEKDISLDLPRDLEICIEHECNTGNIFLKINI